MKYDAKLKFNDEQSESLRMLFDDFYEKAQAIKAIANTARLVLREDDSDSTKITRIDLGQLFILVLEKIEPIYWESLELSCNPDYLHWGYKKP